MKDRCGQYAELDDGQKRAMGSFGKVKSMGIYSYWTHVVNQIMGQK